MRTRMMLVLAGVLVGTLAMPAGAGQLDWAKETNRSACDALGKPVVKVTQHVTGDIDSGFNGGWAVDTYTRRIELWETAPNVYCAVVRYSGTFDAMEGARSPGSDSTGFLDGSEDGNMQGGYRATISGSLLDNPTWPNQGTVGHFDYACVGVGVCPGAVNWVDQYFEPGYGFEYGFWGWVYRAGRAGTWVNAISGSSGDIG